MWLSSYEKIKRLFSNEFFFPGSAGTKILFRVFLWQKKKFIIKTSSRPERWWWNWFPKIPNPKEKKKRTIFPNWRKKKTINDSQIFVCVSYIRSTISYHSFIHKVLEKKRKKEEKYPWMTNIRIYCSGIYTIFWLSFFVLSHIMMMMVRG